MTKKQLLARLKQLLNPIDNHDVEYVHVKADQLLIDYINDPKVTKLYSSIPKWYA